MIRGVVALCLLFGLGCQREDRGELLVFAASSLRGAFEAVEPDFVRLHPNTRVRFNFAGSQELRFQLEHGAPADVYAAADEEQMQRAVASGRVKDPVAFGCNRLAIVVPRGNPAQITGVERLPRARRIILAAPDVPAGRYTRQMLTRASEALGGDFPDRVAAKVISQELNVRQVLTKVQLGEADAGIVYRTDALSAGPAVELIEIQEPFNVKTAYLIAVVEGTKSRPLAQAWVELFLGQPGTLERLGFERCGAPP